MRVFDSNGQPLYMDWSPGMPWDPSWSAMPYFPGYTFEKGISRYKNVDDVGEGGRVEATPGIYHHVALLDISSMHPHSLKAEDYFGKYTQSFYDLVLARVYIKHHEFDKAGELMGGKLKPFLTDEKTADDLAQALKIAINSVYGLTAAKFGNPMRDPRNIDNIIAKRGALFMINLAEQVRAQGYTVAHIKTDSIKIPEADDAVIEFVMNYGREYGYSFEHEATYDRMCLVNDAVYIARYDNQGIRNKKGKHANEWTATGTQFQVPYVFKTLFSHESIEFADVCETKSVSSALYLDMNESLGPDLHDYRFIGKVSSFCPVLPGHGGGELLREATKADGSIGYSAATGCKGYRWLESEDVRSLRNPFDIIDMSYYRRLVDEAVSTIEQFGDFAQFVGEAL